MYMDFIVFEHAESESEGIFSIDGLPIEIPYLLVSIKRAIDICILHFHSTCTSWKVEMTNDARWIHLARPCLHQPVDKNYYKTLKKYEYPSDYESSPGRWKLVICIKTTPSKLTMSITKAVRELFVRKKYPFVWLNITYTVCICRQQVMVYHEQKTLNNGNI